MNLKPNATKNINIMQPNATATIFLNNAKMLISVAIDYGLFFCKILRRL